MGISQLLCCFRPSAVPDAYTRKDAGSLLEAERSEACSDPLVVLLATASTADTSHTVTTKTHNALHQQQMATVASSFIQRFHAAKALPATYEALKVSCSAEYLELLGKWAAQDRELAGHLEQLSECAQASSRALIVYPLACHAVLRDGVCRVVLKMTSRPPPPDWPAAVQGAYVLSISHRVTRTGNLDCRQQQEMALSTIPSVVTVLLPNGQVVYQNPRSVEYCGPLTSVYVPAPGESLMSLSASQHPLKQLFRFDQDALHEFENAIVTEMEFRRVIKVPRRLRSMFAATPRAEAAAEPPVTGAFAASVDSGGSAVNPAAADAGATAPAAALFVRNSSKRVLAMSRPASAIMHQSFTRSSTVMGVQRSGPSGTLLGAGLYRPGNLAGLAGSAMAPVSPMPSNPSGKRRPVRRSTSVAAGIGMSRDRSSQSSTSSRRATGIATSTAILANLAGVHGAGSFGGHVHQRLGLQADRPASGAAGPQAPAPPRVLSHAATAPEATLLQHLENAASGSPMDATMQGGPDDMSRHTASTERLGSMELPAVSGTSRAGGRELSSNSLVSRTSGGGRRSSLASSGHRKMGRQQLHDAIVHAAQQSSAAAAAAAAAGVGDACATSGTGETVTVHLVEVEPLVVDADGVKLELSGSDSSGGSGSSCEHFPAPLTTADTAPSAGADLTTHASSLPTTAGAHWQQDPSPFTSLGARAAAAAAGAGSRTSNSGLRVIGAGSAGQQHIAAHQAMMLLATSPHGSTSSLELARGSTGVPGVDPLLMSEAAAAGSGSSGAAQHSSLSGGQMRLMGGVMPFGLSAIRESAAEHSLPSLMFGPSGSLMMVLGERSTGGTGAGAGGAGGAGAVGASPSISAALPSLSMGFASSARHASSEATSRCLTPVMMPSLNIGMADNGGAGRSEGGILALSCAMHGGGSHRRGSSELSNSAVQQHLALLQLPQLSDLPLQAPHPQGLHVVGGEQQQGQQQPYALPLDSSGSTCGTHYFGGFLSPPDERSGTPAVRPAAAVWHGGVAGGPSNSTPLSLDPHRHHLMPHLGALVSHAPVSNGQVPDGEWLAAGPSAGLSSLERDSAAAGSPGAGRPASAASAAAATAAAACMQASPPTVLLPPTSSGTRPSSAAACDNGSACRWTSGLTPADAAVGDSGRMHSSAHSAQSRVLDELLDQMERQQALQHHNRYGGDMMPVALVSPSSASPVLPYHHTHGLLSSNATTPHAVSGSTHAPPSPAASRTQARLYPMQHQQHPYSVVHGGLSPVSSTDIVPHGSGTAGACSSSQQHACGGRAGSDASLLHMQALHRALYSNEGPYHTTSYLEHIPEAAAAAAAAAGSDVGGCNMASYATAELESILTSRMRAGGGGGTLSAQHTPRGGGGGVLAGRNGTLSSHASMRRRGSVGGGGGSGLQQLLAVELAGGSVTSNTSRSAVKRRTTKERLMSLLTSMEVSGGMHAEDGGANQGGDSVGAVSDDDYEWHDVYATTQVERETGQSVLIITQTEVTHQVEAQRKLAALLEHEHKVLESIFPRHVIEHMTLQQKRREAAAAAAAAAAVSGGASGAATGGGGASGGATPTSASRLLLAAALPSSMGGNTGGSGGGPAGSAWMALRCSDMEALATSHSCVTIMFCDIVGFTAMCKEVTAIEVMHFLNDLYTRFDSLLGIYGVYKVETIGDCYLVVGGLVRTDDEGNKTVIDDGSEDSLHAVRVMSFAKAILREASQVQVPTTGSMVQLRIGLHSGPVVSGIVGEKMPRFCLFGDTVNTASRMESTCTPGTIQVSADTQALLPHEQWQATGGVQVKGKGLMDTYVWAGELEATDEDLARRLQVYL